MPEASQQTGLQFPQTQHLPWGCPYGSVGSPWNRLLSLRNNIYHITYDIEYIIKFTFRDETLCLKPPIKNNAVKITLE